MPASLRLGGRCSTVVTRQCNTRYQCAVALRKKSVVGSEATWRRRQERGSGRQGRKKGNRRVASGEHHCDPVRGKEQDNTSMSRPRKKYACRSDAFHREGECSYGTLTLSLPCRVLQFSSSKESFSGKEKKVEVVQDDMFLNRYLLWCTTLVATCTAFHPSLMNPPAHIPPLARTLTPASSFSAAGCTTRGRRYTISSIEETFLVSLGRTHFG